MKKIFGLILTVSILLVGCGTISNDKKNDLTEELVGYVSNPSEEVLDKIVDAGYTLSFETEYHRFAGKGNFNYDKYDGAPLKDKVGSKLFSISAYGGSFCNLTVDDETSEESSAYVMYNACIGEYTYIAVSLFDENDDYISDFIIGFEDGEYVVNTSAEVDVEFYESKGAEVLDDAFKELNKILK